MNTTALPRLIKVWPDFGQAQNMTRSQAYGFASRLPQDIKVKVGKRLRLNADRLAKYLEAGGDLAQGERSDVKLTYLLERIKSKPEWRESFRARDLLVLVKKTRGFETAAALSHYLDQLCESGHLEKTVSKKTNGRPSICYLVRK